MASSGSTWSRSVKVVGGTTSLRRMFSARASHAVGVARVSHAAGVAGRPRPANESGLVNRARRPAGETAGLSGAGCTENDVPPWYPPPDTVIPGSPPGRDCLTQQRGRVSNPEFPSSYQPDPRLAGGFADAPEGRRERSGD